MYWRNYSGLNGQPVGIDISYDYEHGLPHKKKGYLEVADQHGNRLTSMSISHISIDKFDLDIPSIYPQPFRMKKLKSNDSNNKKITCYADQSSWAAELCFDDRRLHLKIVDQNGGGVFKLLGDVFAKESDFALEAPVQLSLNQVVQRALTANLDARIGFEKVIQAKYAVTAAYLNLIPHLTTNLIWNAEPGYVSAIATLQGLAPFLLPTYWLQAREFQYELKIKKDAEIILKADLAAMAEQLSYAYDRDWAIVQIQESALNSLNGFVRHVNELERLGRVSNGSTQSLISLVNKIIADKEKTQQLMREDQYTISQALGYHNPEAVSRVYVPSFDTSYPVKQIQKDQLADLASRRSFEVRQIDYLKKIAQLKKIELFFAWIDPTGDPKSSFGFNTIAQVKISKSQIRELNLRREQLKQTIYQNTYRIVDQYNSTIDFVNQLISHKFISNPSLDIALNESLRGDFNAAKAVARVEEFLSEEIGLIANLTAHRIAKSKIDRIMLSGFYEFLIPMLNQNDLELNSNLM